MKFPSIQKLTNDAFYTLKRFPIALIFSVLALVLVLESIHEIYFIDQKSTFKLILICNYGMVLFFATSLLKERLNWSINKKIILDICCLILLLIISIAAHFSDENIRFYNRLTVGWIAVHLLCSFLPFFIHGSYSGFWQYNRTLFFRILETQLYTFILIGGLDLALFSIDQLFPIEINYKAYLWVASVVGILFSSWFFMAGMPKNCLQLDQETDYPKGLLVFTQYVLLPLITIYLTILYVYGGKILVLMDLPKGMVSYLVIAFSVTGILSLLLIEPIKNEENNTWIHNFSKWFYIAVLPLVLLLFVAIGYRVSEYGITENRYYILLTACWLAAMSFYFIFSKSKNIKIIPISLFIISILSVFGPWSAFSVSENSQLNTFEKLLAKNNIIGKNHNPIKILHKEEVRIGSIVNYFENRGKSNVFEKYITVPTDSFFTQKYNYNRASDIMSLLGLSMKYNENDSTKSDYISIYAQNQNVYNILNCNELLVINWYKNYSSDSIITEKLNSNYSYRFNEKYREICITNNKINDTLNLYDFFTKIIAKKKETETELSQEELTYETQKHKVFLKQMSVTNNKIESMDLLIGVKK